MKTDLGRTLSTLALALGLAAASTGCVKKMILDGQIESTRKASAAIDTLADYDVANNIAFAGLGQFEGMHYLAPENENALFMLTKGWAGATFAFIEDQMEQAEDAEGDSSALFEYHKQRAKVGYERAVHYGIEMLEMKNAGFEAAKKNDQTIRAWLKGFDDPEHDTPELFWTAQAWMAKVNVMKDDPATVSELYVGVAMMERAVELDEKYLYGSGHVVLGAYHARTAQAELDESKQHFDKALAISGGKLLLAKFQLASKLYCMKGDKESYEKTLNEVVEAVDPLPEARLTNAVAKRRAKRYLSKSREKNCGF